MFFLITDYGEYVPKSYYVIDHSGHKSDVIYVRSRRDLLPLLRPRRTPGGGSSASSSAHASASASASSSAGASSGGNSGSGAGENTNYDAYGNVLYASWQKR